VSSRPPNGVEIVGIFVLVIRRSLLSDDVRRSRWIVAVVVVVDVHPRRLRLLVRFVTARLTLEFRFLSEHRGRRRRHGIVGIFSAATAPRPRGVDRPARGVVPDVAIHVVHGRGNGPRVYERRHGDVADEGVSHHHLERRRGVVAVAARGRPRRGWRQRLRPRPPPVAPEISETRLAAMTTELPPPRVLLPPAVVRLLLREDQTIHLLPSAAIGLDHATASGALLPPPLLVGTRRELELIIETERIVTVGEHD
jgi:hypothetical protein